MTDKRPTLTLKPTAKPARSTAAGAGARPAAAGSPKPSAAPAAKPTYRPSAEREAAVDAKARRAPPPREAPRLRETHQV